MKVQLTGLKQLSVSMDTQDITHISDGWIPLKVSHCAICRTDAKMWGQGHRDLFLPRVLGHEIVAVQGDKRYAVWPGVVCGTCYYCRSGRENLCNSMKIIGFHLDGGFCDTVIVPESNCLLIPDQVTSAIATFAEPAGCIVNAFDKVKLMQNSRLLIYGAGTIGILAALLSLHYGAIPVIIEKNETKITKAKCFSANHGLNFVKNTDESHFDVIVNCCSDPMAFISSIPKTANGASIVFFSGLEKNMQIESNLLNLIHYKELNIIGAYGLTKQNMKTGLHLVSQNQKSIELLVESIISPDSVPEIIPKVLQGECFKYILSFENKNQKTIGKQPELKITDNRAKQTIPDFLKIKIAETSESIRAQACQKIYSKTKPLGSLGKLEDMAVQMCTIQNTLSPVLHRKAMFVFAADHGIAEEGVSAFPQEVTCQMVQSFLNGGAAINALSSITGLDLLIIDIGVKGKIAAHPRLISKRVAEGTKNFAVQFAMSIKEAEAAFAAGADIFNMEYSVKKIDIIGLGEMGIGNTTAATAIISAITNVPVRQCTGRGTGIDEQGVEHKIKIIEKALTFHKPDSNDALDVLCKVGGFEIAGMAGAALAAASKGCAVVLDGLISTAAGLIAYTIDPSIAHYLIAGHKSVEIGQKAALNHMGLLPVLDLNMRLGEGTGAALTINLASAACKIINDMASFDDAGISVK